MNDCKETVRDLRTCVKQANGYQQQCWEVYRAALRIKLSLEQTLETGELYLKGHRDLPDLMAAALSTIEFARLLVQVQPA